MGSGVRYSDSGKPSKLGGGSAPGLDLPTALLSIAKEGETTATTEEWLRSLDPPVIARIEQWWNGLEDRSARQKVKTYYGDQPLHELLERSTWHSAQHGRQLVAVLERYGIEPDGPLTKEQLAGLPLPERLWE